MTRQISTVMGFLLAANLLAWAWAWHEFHDRPAMLSTALLAWVFGLRHAVDADHIAAIDNVVRKLARGGRRAWDCGLFFALGHSVIVLLLCLGIAVFPATSEVERVRDAIGDYGTMVSAGFLMLIAMANLLTLTRLLRARRGEPVEVRVAAGAMSRILRPVQRLVGRGWHMLPVGFLFGLGFDTATEVALLVLTAQQTASGLSAASVLVFPALFAAGMVLIDTADSAAMNGAYGWASNEPGRKLTYDIAITVLSVFAAAGVGGLEVLGLLVDRGGGPRIVAWLLDTLPFLGFGIVAVLLSLWGFAALATRIRPRTVESEG
ncbi:MAG: HoxN/HupN/NixA family nickel/cobalt transporter [Acetobacteraceae bacterium]|nr:HoxN/HupN/NixA family nickel/cobalt transporter [Acetobacteraceae bacterium]